MAGHGERRLAVPEQLRMSRGRSRNLIGATKRDDPAIASFIHGAAWTEAVEEITNDAEVEQLVEHRLPV